MRIYWLRTIKSIDQSTFTVEVLEIDENGKARATGRMQTLQADSLIMVIDRADSFEAVLAGLRKPDARYEAQRCLSCGNCFECDSCQGACPSEAIRKLDVGKGYRVDLDRCTGCAVCFEQCPCHAIEMVDEPAVGAQGE